MGIFEYSHVSPNAPVRIVWFLRRLFSIDSNTREPLTSGFFLECDLFDRLSIWNISVFHHGNIRELRQGKYSVTVLTIELEARLHICEAAKLARCFPVETPDVVAVFLILREP